jgi:hypothetical protein
MTERAVTFRRVPGSSVVSDDLWEDRARAGMKKASTMPNTKAM